MIFTLNCPLKYFAYKRIARCHPRPYPGQRRDQVLEALIDGDGEWDALVVERDTPVMDGFQIASGLRDFEKARRNRSSMVRAAAVEGHVKAGGGGATTGGQGRQQADGGKVCASAKDLVFWPLDGAGECSFCLGCLGGGARTLCDVAWMPMACWTSALCIHRHVAST